ncbi:hypothetical protein [Ruania alba]|uniref:Uncharacterized protein n=1 Tax=Ruania alba TaxID=648782 RepID=A0A1H5KHA1_9MICO|nr:hypothetical protein [Ruania alba]SEE64163.1 hypothetical protein SAMN04488554_2264 [Ruania alba]
MSIPPPPAPTSTTGPKILTFSGAAVLVLAIAVIVVVVRLFLSVLPFGVVAADGAPGPDAAGGTEVPGTVSLELTADSTYVVYLAHPSGLDGVELAEAVTVTGPGGTPVAGIPAPASSSTMNGVTAQDVFAFRTDAAGEYTVAAPALADSAATPWATVVVAEGHDMQGFFGGLFGSVFGVFAAIALGVAGVGMTLGGAIWWYIRVHPQRPYAPH